MSTDRTEYGEKSWRNHEYCTQHLSHAARTGTLGQTVVVIGGSAGIGLETARRARAEGAKVILTGRNPERLQRAASELDALSTATFDANDPCSPRAVLPGPAAPSTT